MEYEVQAASAVAAGPSEFVTDGSNVWLGTLGHPYVWRAGPAGLRASDLFDADGEPVTNLAVGETVLWVIVVDPVSLDLTLIATDTRDDRERSEQKAPTGCSRNGAWVMQDTLWLYCPDGITGFRAEETAPVRVIAAEGQSALLAARNTLWRLEGDAITAIAGESEGTSWPLPETETLKWRSSGVYAWLLGIGGDLLLRVDLETGDVASFPIEARDLSRTDFEPVGDEVWISDVDSRSVVRFRPTAGPSPVGQIAVAPADETVIHVALTPTREAAWIVATTIEGARTRLFRVPLATIR